MNHVLFIKRQGVYSPLPAVSSVDFALLTDEVCVEVDKRTHMLAVVLVNPYLVV